MEAISYGLSTIIGIVIGVIVTVGADYLKNRNQYKKDLRTLGHEIENNIYKIDGWLEVAQDYKNKVASDRITDFFGYFNFSSALFACSFKLFNQGMLYSFLDYEDIDDLQQCWNYLSLNFENFVNTNISNNKQAYLNGNYNKRDILRDIDFIEERLKKAKRDLKRIKSKL